VRICTLVAMAVCLCSVPAVAGGGTTPAGWQWSPSPSYQHYPEWDDVLAPGDTATIDILFWDDDTSSNGGVATLCVDTEWAWGAADGSDPEEYPGTWSLLFGGGHLVVTYTAPGIMSPPGVPWSDWSGWLHVVGTDSNQIQARNDPEVVEWEFDFQRAGWDF
jgi:hypothetical protein